MSETVVLSFSIVRAGNTDNYNTIGIAASVVDKNYKQIDSFFAGCYFDGHDNPIRTNFDATYKETFWKDKQNLLDKLKYEGILDPFDQEGKMISAFMKFLSDWEKRVKYTGMILELATDNPTFNAGFINIMISEHTDMYPLPFTTDGDSRILLDTVSQQKGVLLTMCKFPIHPTKYSKLIKDIYNLNNLEANPYISVDYLHDTVYEIALDQQILNNIRDQSLVPNTQVIDELNRTYKPEEYEIDLGESVDL
jgi:hypothetical protein